METAAKALLTFLLIIASKYVFLLSNIYCFAILISNLVIFWYFDNSKLKNLPPGPSIFGDLLNLFYMKSMYEYCHSLHEKYGPITRISYSGSCLLLVNDHAIIKELSVHPDLQLRPQFPHMTHDIFTKGIINSSGNLWKHQRRFLLHSLRDSGMGKIRMEEKIHHELGNLMKVLENSKGRPMTLQLLLRKATANVICGLAFNTQFDYDDQELRTTMEAVDNITNNSNALLGFLAILQKVFPPLFQIYVNKFAGKFDPINALSHKFFERHRATLDSNNPRDLLDLYLIEMDKVVKGSDDDGGYHETFFEKQLHHVISDIFLAGMETSSKTISWALFYMIHHPEIQEKVRKEIDDVVGSERYPKMEDRLNLPYTAATLQEVERLGSIVPLSVARSSDKPVKYQDYVFPKNSAIMFNLYSLHRDPQLWKNPEEFDPTRFIDSDGKVFRPPHLSPFGSGKRSCAGEGLARMEIFLLFSTLLQNFVFEAVNKASPPLEKSPNKVQRSPGDYEIKCIRR